jgi:lipase chaperone LimK
MKKELHELRKMESGWFGKDKNYIKKEVIVKNNHYLEEKEKVTNELTTLRERHSTVVKERDSLLARLRALEADLGRVNGEYSTSRNAWL